MKSTSYFAHSLCAFSLLTAVFSGHAFDMSGIKSDLKKSYYRFWLIHPISTVAEAKVSDWCREGIQVEKVAREKVLEKYETPRWVTWVSTIFPLKESMFDYAYDIYQKIQLEMDGLMKQINNEIDNNSLSKDSRESLEEQQAAWRALEQKLIYVLGAKGDTIDVTEKNILDNIKEALAIVDALIRILPDLKFAPPAPKNQQSLMVKTERLKKEAAERVRAILVAFLDRDVCGTEILKNKRLSWIERWHRKKQAEWLANYVNNVCSVCALR